MNPRPFQRGDRVRLLLVPGMHDDRLTLPIETTVARPARRGSRWLLVNDARAGDGVWWTWSECLELIEAAS